MMMQAFTGDMRLETTEPTAEERREPRQITPAINVDGVDITLYNMAQIPKGRKIQQIITFNRSNKLALHRWYR